MDLLNMDIFSDNESEHSIIENDENLNISENDKKSSNEKNILEKNSIEYNDEKNDNEDSINISEIEKNSANEENLLKKNSIQINDDKNTNDENGNISKNDEKSPNQDKFPRNNSMEINDDNNRSNDNLNIAENGKYSQNQDNFKETNSMEINDDNLPSSSNAKVAKSEIIFTSNEDFESIDKNDPNVDITAYVDNINSLKPVGKRGQYKVMSFTINNGQGTRCTVSVWNKEIARIEPNLQLNQILLLEGLKSAEILYPQFNDGNTNYELQVQDYTTVTVLNNFNENNFKNNKIIKLINFEDLKNVNGLIKIQGFIKSTIRPVKLVIQDELINYYIGSITDGFYKTELRINNMEEDKELFNKGDHIEVSGVIKHTSEEKLVYILVNQISDIKLLDEEKMPFLEVLNGYRSISSD